MLYETFVNQQNVERTVAFTQTNPRAPSIFPFSHFPHPSFPLHLSADELSLRKLSKVNTKRYGGGKEGERGKMERRRTAGGGELGRT